MHGTDAKTTGNPLTLLRFLKCGEVSIHRELWREKFELTEYYFKIRVLSIPDHRS